MDKEKYGKDLKALGKHLLIKGDEEGLKLYDTLLSDLNTQQDEITRYLKKETMLTEKGVKEVVRIALQT